ncbi:hypothetical protein [Roseivirga sp.]|uniref:hypothetical protein n=1 Tax=Roseivirga sp. TaxID=1964215 RepID=UPI003B51A19D
MTQRSREITAALFLLCFLAPLGLTYGLLKVKQWKVKTEVEQQILQGIDKGELLELTFSLEEAANLDWEHEREFEYQGQSYDVVDKVVKDGYVTYQVWWDKIETRIKNQLAQLVSRALSQDEQQQGNQDNLERLLKAVYYQNSENPVQVAGQSEQVRFHSFSQGYKSMEWAPPVPPPITS